MIVFSKTHIPDSLSLCEKKSYNKRAKMKMINEKKKPAEKCIGIYLAFYSYSLHAHGEIDYIN